jgi:hypothetical protein
MTESTLKWRKSTYSGTQSECVEVAEHPGGHLLVRNSNRPAAGTLAVPPAEWGAWLGAWRGGALDDLTRIG